MLLAGLGYRMDLLLGPTVALYLLAASREPTTPWTWRTTGTVVGLLWRTWARPRPRGDGFPGSELLHTGLAWAAAWFAGERTRLRREQVAELRQRVPCAPSGRRSASGCWPPPRSAPGSPATSTTPPATRSA